MAPATAACRMSRSFYGRFAFSISGCSTKSMRISKIFSELSSSARASR